MDSLLLETPQERKKKYLYKITIKYSAMSLSDKLKKYLLKNGATEVGFADITNFSPKPNLNTGVVLYNLSKGNC